MTATTRLMFVQAIREGRMGDAMKIHLTAQLRGER